MPKFVVGAEIFYISEEMLKPLLDADVLYQDDGEEGWPKGPHYHLNPESVWFGELELACSLKGIAALPTAEQAAAIEQAEAMALHDPNGHTLANAYSLVNTYRRQRSVFRRARLALEETQGTTFAVSTMSMTATTSGSGTWMQELANTDEPTTET